MKPELIITILILFGTVGLSSSAHTHGHVFSRLKNAGILVSSSGNCSARNIATCTSFDEIREEAVSGLIAFKNASGCSIVVTGGTETGRPHENSDFYSHWNGFKVDIRMNYCVTNYITTQFASNGTRADGAKLYRSPSGDLYAEEGNHWDVVYVRKPTVPEITATVTSRVSVYPRDQQDNHTEATTSEQVTSGNCVKNANIITRAISHIIVSLSLTCVLYSIFMS